jgi:hypothetical protein
LLHDWFSTKPIFVPNKRYHAYRHFLPTTVPHCMPCLKVYPIQRCILSSFRHFFRVSFRRLTVLQLYVLTLSLFSSTPPPSPQKNYQSTNHCGHQTQVKSFFYYKYV